MNVQHSKFLLKQNNDNNSQKPNTYIYNIESSSPPSVKELPWLPSENYDIATFIYVLLSDPTSSFLAFIINVTITLLIILSCLSFILESMPQYRFPNVGNSEHDTLPLFQEFEKIAIFIFTVEYLLRFFLANAVSYYILDEKQSKNVPETKQAKHMSETKTKQTKIAITSNASENGPIVIQNASENGPIVIQNASENGPIVIQNESESESDVENGFGIRLHKTWVFFKQTYNLVDFFAILPFYISIITKNDSSSQFSFLRILRLARVFRVFKLGKYSDGALLYSEVLKKSSEVLYLLLFFSLMISVIMGSLIYYFEKGEWIENGCQTGTRGCFMRNKIIPGGKEESPFYSIPQSIWWVVSTITTVGYGDIYPTTFGGKIIAIITMHIGLLGLALPISIIGTNFRQKYKQNYKQKKIEKEMQNINTSQLVMKMKCNLEHIMTECHQLSSYIGMYDGMHIGSGIGMKSFDFQKSLDVPMNNNQNISKCQLLQMQRSLAIMSDTITNALRSKTDTNIGIVVNNDDNK